MERLTVEGQEELFALISRAFEIYNAFSPGNAGEKKLLKIRDQILHRQRAGDAADASITLTLPLGLAGYMMASAKHLGDLCTAVSRMGKEGTLFEQDSEEE